MSSSKSSKGNLKGNTKQISPAIHWVFTFNNYTTNDIEELCKLVCKKYIFQEEKGNGTICPHTGALLKEGVPHLQGYVEFKEKVRPIGLVSNKIHWAVSKDKKNNYKKAIEYCHKIATRTGSVYSNFYEEIKTINKSSFYQWQNNIFEILMNNSDDRHIHWLWEDIGNVGKTAFAKYMCVHHGAIILSGKGSDMKNGVLDYIKNNNRSPKIIIIDIPRVSTDYVSYSGIEEIKNGLFYSSKYEGGQVIMNPPHIICFANKEADTWKMSQDRWKIIEIKQDVC